MRSIYCIIIVCLLSMPATAQDSTKQDNSMDNAWNAKVGGIGADTSKGKKGKALVIDNHGIAITDKDTTKPEKVFDYTVAGLDVGINSLVDNTSYSSTATQSFLNVPASMKNENLFSLRTGKSWNVNIWPVLVKARLLKTNGQKIYLSSGIGLQTYNFRFSKDISYLNNTVPEVILDSVNFTKNKLALCYLAVPLSFTLKTNLGGKIWLVYGAGVTGGYRISSWTKQKSVARGTQKNHDAFNFNDFNACVTGEIGVEGILRIFASYQVTSLHETGLDQRPFTIGLRFGGV